MFLNLMNWKPHQNFLLDWKRPLFSFIVLSIFKPMLPSADELLRIAFSVRLCVCMYSCSILLWSHFPRSGAPKWWIYALSRWRSFAGLAYMYKTQNTWKRPKVHNVITALLWGLWALRLPPAWCTQMVNLCPFQAALICRFDFRSGTSHKDSPKGFSLVSLRRRPLHSI